MKSRQLAGIHPGEILQEEFLKPMAITQYRLAKDIGVPPRRINGIVNGQRALTADSGPAPVSFDVRPIGYFKLMSGLRYVYWQDGEFWLGYLEEFPDYMTQGESLEDLQEHLRDLYADLAGGHIPAVRRYAELEVR